MCYIILSLSVWAHLDLKEQFVFPRLVNTLLVSILGTFISLRFDFMLQDLVFLGNLPLALFLSSTTVCESLQALPRRTIAECKHMAHSILNCFSTLYHKNFQTFNSLKNFTVNTYRLTTSIINILLYFIICSCAFPLSISLFFWCISKLLHTSVQFSLNNAVRMSKLSPKYFSLSFVFWGKIYSEPHKS